MVDDLIKVSLAPYFVNDYLERGLGCDLVVDFSGSNKALVEGSESALQALLSDATHYAHIDGPDVLPSGLRRSAVSVRDKLKSLLAA